MARPGITYKQVADAAQGLSETGTNPTIGAVREALGGTGSPNTIHKHLTAWKDGNAQPVAKNAEFPARLIQALQEEISKAATAAREQVQIELVATQTEAIELAKAGETIEAERDSLADQVGMLTTERDQAHAVATERLEEIKRQERQIEQQMSQIRTIQSAGELVRTELIKAELKIEAEAEKLAKQVKDLQQMRQEVNTTIKERSDAYQSVAVMTAKLEAAERRASEAEAREKATAAKLERSEAEARQERSETTKSRVHIQSQQIALDTAAREIEQLKKAVVKPAKAKAAPVA